MRNKKQTTILPYKSQEGNLPLQIGSRIGILGSGQLGQMMAVAAKKLGYKVVVYDTVADGPAVAIADHSMVASFNDQEALRHFAESVDVITLEFENIPVATLELLALLKPLYPTPNVVRICQDRVLEKEFLQAHGFSVAPFQVITSEAELTRALAFFDSPCILKTATLGYDGKGQCSLQPGDDLKTAWESLKTTRAVLEKKITFLAEASVITARSITGEIISFPPQENRHRDGILDASIIPPRFETQITEQVEQLGNSIAKALGIVGLITVELFVLPEGKLVVNELAPRPHNSGHHTIESLKTSQFEQMMRALVGLPLKSLEQRSHAAVMVNLLGDLWNKGEPNWQPLLDHSHVNLHLYGKKEARPGRKMGHFTITGDHREKILATAEHLFQGLEKESEHSG